MCGNNHADLHFATGMRNIYGYVNEMGRDLYRPIHFISALEYYRGLGNAFAEQYSIDLNAPGLREVLQAVKKKGIVRMDCVAELQYERDGDKYIVNVFKYLGGAVEE